MKNNDYKKVVAMFCVSLMLCGLLFAADDGLAPEVIDLNAKDASMELEKSIPYLETPYLSSQPKDMKDGIQVGVLGKDGGDKEMILEFAREIAEEPNKRERCKTDSILISYKDKLLFESYYRRGRQNLPHFQMSITKSYTAFALGRAIQLGYLTLDDLNNPVIDYLKDLDRSKLAKGAEKITLAEALNMKSGIKLIKEKIQPYKDTPEKLVGQKQVQVYFESCEPIVAAPDRDFRYQPADPALIMQVLDVIVPGTAKDFIQKELMGKMGITDYAWQPDTSGLPKSAAGSSFRSRDMIKIGKMILDKGKWDGEQLIPEAFIEKALSPISVSYGANYYGYFCWYQDFKLGEKKYQYLQLRGALGQFVLIFPELELIVVSTGHGAMGHMLKDVPKRIVPAFVK
jgi:CubicO group peptidase (beta-lactamase class C family)